jgi:hypothetical protein
LVPVALGSLHAGKLVHCRMRRADGVCRGVELGARRASSSLPGIKPSDIHII